MSVTAPMATGPICFRCLYEMPSGPTEEVGFVCSIACLVMLGVKRSGGSWAKVFHSYLVFDYCTILQVFLLFSNLNDIVCLEELRIRY